MHVCVCVCEIHVPGYRSLIFLFKRLYVSIAAYIYTKNQVAKRFRTRAIGLRRKCPLVPTGVFSS